MMKVKIFATFFIFLASIGIFENKAIAWGPITHMTLLDDILNDPRLDPTVKKILQENLFLIGKSRKNRVRLVY